MLICAKYCQYAIAVVFYHAMAVICLERDLHVQHGCVYF